MREKAQRGLSRYSLLFFMFFLLFFTLKAEQQERKYPSYYLGFSYSSGKINVGDINNCLTSFNDNDLFRYVRNYNPYWGEVQGEILPLPGKFNSFDLSLFIDLNPKLTVGLSIFEPVQKKNESSLLFSLYINGHTQRMFYYFQPKYWLLCPLEYTFYYKIIDFPRFRFSAGAGSGFYFAGISRTYVYEQRVPVPEGEKVVSTYKIKTRRYPFLSLVGHLNFLTEYSLNSRLSLTSEIRLRYGRISNFKGAESLERISVDLDGNYEIWVKGKERGTLYYFREEDQDIGEVYYRMTVWSKIPDASIGFLRDVKKASLDLSGVSFKLGLKIRLF